MNVPDWWTLTDCGFETPCWIWTRVINKGGYAKLGTRLVHRIHWIERNGPIPVGHELDHLCKQTACVNPDHVEPVTHAINVRRGRVAKINQETAEKIRAEVGSLRAIGARYGLHHTTVLAIRKGTRSRGVTWT